MSFQPVLPFTGYNGWQFLQRTLPAQTEAFRAGAELSRDVAHSQAYLGEAVTAEQLVDDRQLLKVALGAFGLQDDLPNRAFIERILSDGTTDPQALSNRLADKRYQAFASAFDFGGVLPGPQRIGFADDLIDDYQTRAFEIAVGEQNTDMRIAFTFTREMAEIAGEDTTVDTKWFTVMGNPPLRQAFETALGLPDGFGTLDIDQQLDVFKDRLQSFLGDDDLAQFTDAGKREEFVRLFLLRSELLAGPSATTPGMAALTLLSNQRPSGDLLQIALLG